MIVWRGKTLKGNHCMDDGDFEGESSQKKYLSSWLTEKPLECPGDGSFKKRPHLYP